MSSIPLPALGVQPPRAPDLLGSVGQALAIKSQMGQQQLQQQSLQTSQLANQQTQQAIQLQAQKVKDQKTVTDLYVKNNGDLDQTIADAAKAGVTPETLQQLQLHSIDVKGKLLDLAGKQGAEATRQSDLMQGAYQQVATADPAQRPALYQQELMGLQRQGVDVSKMPVQYPGDQQFKILGATVQGYSKQLSQAVQQSEADKNTAAAASSQAEADKNTAIAQFYKQNPTAGAPGVPTEAVEMSDWLKKNPGKGPADFMKAKSLMVPAFNLNMQSGLLNDQAKDMAAENYFQTGQLPAGARSPGMISSIINRAGELHPGGNLAGNKAAFEANKGSLDSIQKNFDQVTAFENTAGKNLDTFLNAAKKITDTGSPILNKPLRTINAQALGDPDQVAAYTAGTTALTEIAKVLNSSNASGVLSDSARHEVEGLIGQGATLKQIQSAANILKTDMSNRHQAYDMQIQDIKKRLGVPATTPPQGQTQQQGGDFFSNFGGKPR